MSIIPRRYLLFRFRVAHCLVLFALVSIALTTVLLEYRALRAEEQAIESLIEENGYIATFENKKSWLLHLGLYDSDFYNASSLEIGSIGAYEHVGTSSMTRFLIEKSPLSEQISYDRIGDLRYLESLTIETRLLDDNGLNKVRGLKTLEHLTLASDLISPHAVINFVQSLPNLKTLHIKSNSFSAAELLPLSHSSPNLELQCEKANWEEIGDCFWQQKYIDELSQQKEKSKKPEKSFEEKLRDLVEIY